MLETLKRHWPEYFMEAAGLGIFMLSAALWGTLLEHPSSPIRGAIDDPFLRRIPMGLAMGLTAIGIIYSPWGQRSGAHINPAVTLTFSRLGKISRSDTLFYVLAQFAGGLAGVLLAAVFIGTYLADPFVNYVVTVPGSHGAVIAFMAEFVISFLLMMVVLFSTNSVRLAPFTGLFAGMLVTAYVILEAPLSGFGMNPARTFASALPAWVWTSIWIYFTAPVVGMLLAAEVYLRVSRTRTVMCAKLHHQNTKQCIFNCGYKRQWEGRAKHIPRADECTSNWIEAGKERCGGSVPESNEPHPKIGVGK